MTHDFDAAFKDYDELIRQSDWAKGHMGSNSDAIRFALRFTKAALSGEVSDAVLDAAYHSAHETYPGVFQTTLLPPDEIFPAMCKQLAKEVGNGNE